MPESVNYVPPAKQRYLRACMVCSVVLTHQRFFQEGCPNCEEALQLRRSTEQIDACTSQVFEGVISLQDPARSWIAKWQRLDTYVPGVYAVKVSGQLPDDIQAQLREEFGITYVPYVGMGRARRFVWGLFEC